jgi:hypothetical protein
MYALDQVGFFDDSRYTVLGGYAFAKGGSTKIRIYSSLCADGNTNLSANHANKTEQFTKTREQKRSG